MGDTGCPTLLVGLERIESSKVGASFGKSRFHKTGNAIGGVTERNKATLNTDRRQVWRFHVDC
jgi:hypothetical protein